jgi:large subunit ribosomal protein L44e
MVTVPKVVNTFCKSCKHHCEHRVTKSVRAPTRDESQGQRRYDRKMKGYGGQKKPIQRNQAKITKDIPLKMECLECAGKHNRVLPASYVFQIVRA